MNAIKRITGLALLLVGVGYTFVEFVVAIGERHLLHGWNILTFAIVMMMGFGVAGLGAFLAFGRSGSKVA